MVLLNTGGGLTGGDRIAVSADVGAGAEMSLTTQAAERVYRASDDTDAHVAVRLGVGNGGVLRWLPQETILFDRARIARSFDVTLGTGATFVGLEAVVLGRRAMGERVTSAALTDRWRIRCNDTLLWADQLVLSGDLEAHFDDPAVGNGARSYASLVVAGPLAEAAVAHMRPVLPPTAGVSLVRPDLALARVLAPDAKSLRAALIPLLAAASGQVLPRVWTF